MIKLRDASNVMITALGQDPRTSEWHRVLEIRDPDGRIATVTIPFEDTNESAMLSAIGRAGYPTPIIRSDRAGLLLRLKSDTPAARTIIASCSGWVTSKVFVTPTGAYSCDDTPVTLSGNLLEEHRFHIAGNLKQWQQHVAAPAFGNSNAMFAIMLAFVGPVLRLMDAPNAGFHLVGASSTGKTSLLVVAGSVWGGCAGPLGFNSSWHTTSNALDRTAAAHNECFLGLDEAKLAGNTPKEAANNILRAVHQLAAGHEKIRLTDRRSSMRYSIAYLGSSEETLDEMAAHAGQTVSWGHRVRCIDIKSDAGRNMGVWEELHAPDQSPALFADSLRNAALKYHGTAADAFLTALVGETSKPKEWVTKYLRDRAAKFVGAIGATGWDPAQARIARQFALVYAAGRLARKFDVLPWDWKPMLVAVRNCFRRVVMPAGSTTPHTPAVSMETVRSYITTNKERFIDLRTPRDALTKGELSYAYGIIYRTKVGQVEYLFANDRFRNAICAGLPAERVLADLNKGGMLNIHSGGKWGVTRDFPKPLGRARVISIKADHL